MGNGEQIARSHDNANVSSAPVPTGCNRGNHGGITSQGMVFYDLAIAGGDGNENSRE